MCSGYWTSRSAHSANRSCIDNVNALKKCSDLISDVKSENQRRTESSNIDEDQNGNARVKYRRYLWYKKDRKKGRKKESMLQ